MKRIAGVLLLLMAVSFAVLWRARSRTRAPQTAEDLAHLPKSPALAPLFDAPDWSFRAHTGEQVSAASLRGQPWVANFIFTTCRTVCPTLTAKLTRLTRLLDGVPARFVSFSVDPQHDTAEVLAAYAKQWNPDEPRWLLLETTEAGLAAVADGFHVTAQRADGGLDAVLHSQVFVLVDAQGVVRGIYDSDEPDDFRALQTAVRTLSGAAAAVAPPERSGETLFHELTCANCHERPELAPPLGGLLGRRREFDNGLTAVADEAYLRESILIPGLKRVRGYPLMMPSYAGQLRDDELQRLITYVAALAPSPEPSPEVPVEVDPVCHMKVRVVPDALQAPSADGGIVYFCSNWCRQRYQTNTDAFRH
mgnify:CR=1 FL=1